MVKRQEGKSAEEFMADLRHDHDYMARVNAQRDRAKAREEAEAALLAKLADLGIRETTLQGLVERCAPLSPALAGALVRLLNQTDDTALQEGIVPRCEGVVSLPVQIDSCGAWRRL